MVLMREADPVRAGELADQALAAIGDSDPVARFDALRVRWNAAYWMGHLGEAETYLREQMEVARAAGRKDLESVALLTRAETYLAMLDLDEAEAKLERARALAEESGTIAPRARVLLAWSRIYLVRGHLEQAETAIEEAKHLFSEAGAVWAVARALNLGGWAAWASGDLEKGEKRFRESIRLLKPLGDRAHLCESQRGLAELLIQRGRVEEAERFAYDARETVGPLDVTSRATTAGSLAMVRAAQGRHDDAEALFREGLETLADTEFRQIEDELLESFAQFERDRGRDDEAAALEERRDALRNAPKSSARIA
jgi:tetratricopeptide (TPR) repeat protein